MSSTNLFGLLIKLESSKIKDRNDALAGLEELVESGQPLSHKDLTSLCEGLFAFIENEKAAYSKNQAVAAELRLQSSSYMLRKIVTENAKEMKFKLVKPLLNFCKEIIFDYKGGLIKPLALNISKIFSTLLSIDQHRDHIASEDWVKLIEAILRLLNEQIKSSMTDKFVSELLCALRALVVNPLIAIEDLGFDLSNFLANYFRTMKKESSLTAIVLEITNNLIITLSTSKVRYSIKLVKVVLKISGSLVNTNYESLRDQVLIFGLLANDFICENLPKLIEVESSQDPSIDDDGTRDDLIYWIDQWVQHILRTPFDMLSLQNIEFLNSSTERSWFNFGYIRLASSSAPKPWLSILALTKLINSLYQLERPLFHDSETPAKRRKLGSASYASVLEKCESPLQLCMYFINSSNLPLQKIGFQLLTFHIYNYAPELASIKFSEIVTYYDKPELSGFTSLVVKSLIENCWKLSNNELCQILRINLQSLKDKNVVNVASQTIIQVLKYPNFTVSDNSVYLQIQSVFEISEINGPVIITNDTLKFWVVFCQHGKGFKSQNKKVGDRIVDWLLTKWNSDNLFETSVFPYFIAWLSGSIFNHTDDEVIYESIFSNFCAKWHQKSALANFILRTWTPSFPKHSASTLQTPNIMIELDSITPVVDQLICDLEYYDNKSYGYPLMKLVKYAHIIYQNIVSLKPLDSASERLKYDIRRLLENFQPDKFEDYNEAAFQLTDFRMVNEFGEFIFDCINVQDLASNVLLIHEKQHESFNANSAGADSSVIMSDFGDFGQVRKESKEVDAQESKTYLDLELYCTVEQKVLKLIIAMNSQFTNTKNLNTTVDQALRMLESLRPEGFTCGLFTLLGYLQNIDVLKIQTVSISKLLRLLGNKLLSSYRFERSPVTIILASRLFTVFTKAWLMKITESWASDYSDMFKWIVSLAEKGLIAEEISLYYFIESIFVKLSYESDSTSQEVGISLFHKSSNFNKVELCDGIKSFIKNLEPLEQTRCLEAIYSGFINPQILDDSAATFTYCMGVLITVSYPLFIGGVSQLLLNYGYFHFAPYIEAAFMKINEEVLQQDFVLLEFLKSWYETRPDLSTFPFLLFGFEDKKSFYVAHHQLIYPILVSNKKTPVAAIVNCELMGGVMDESELLLNTLSLSIPLSYAKNGRRGELLKLINDTYDASLVEHQALLVVKRFLDLCDFSKELNFQKYFTSIKDDFILSQLFRQKALHENDGSSHINISVSFSIVVHQISLLTSGLQNFWSPAAVLFLTRSAIKSLFLATDANEKLICLKRLKLIIILGTNGFHNQDVIFSVLEFLYPYISDPEIHDQVCFIVVTLLDISKKDINDLEQYYAILLMVFHEAVKYRKQASSVCYILEQFLVDANASIEFEGIWKILFLPLVHLLTLNTAALDGLLIMQYNHRINVEFPRTAYISIHDILKNAASEKSGKMKRLMFEVLSTFLREVPRLNEIDWNLVTDKNVAIALLEFKPSLSPEFDLFKARYLARHHLLTGEGLSELDKEVITTIEYELVAKTSALYGVFDELLEKRKTTQNLEELVIIDGVLGVAFFEHNRGGLKDSPLVSFDRHLKDQVKFILPLDLFTFKLINSDYQGSYDWADMLDDSENGMKPAVVWLRDILLSIFHGFEEHSPIFSALMVYIYRFPEFSSSIIYQVFLFQICHGRSTAEKLSLRFISNMLDRDDVFQMSKEKIEIVLKICYLLRIGKDEIKPFNNVFRDLNLKRIYQLSCHVGLPKLGLSFFEIYYSDYSLNKTIKWRDDTKTLKNIYEQLGDGDLLYGIPVDPTLGYAMSSLNRGEQNGWKSVIFNSANLDSSIALIDYSNFDISTARSMMLKSLVDNSLHGVSELLNDTMDPQKRLINSYEWCWKLNQWDIPVSDTPYTENEAIYKALKSFHDDIQKGKTVCEELMVETLGLNQVNKAAPLLKKLCSLHNIETVHSLDSTNLMEEHKCCVSYTDKWFPLVSFSEIENIMLTRKVSFGNNSVSGCINSTDGLVSEITEMKRYGYYARLHGEVQKATNASIWIDKRIQGDMNQELKLYLTKISNFESACTLWSQGETAISIAMLKDNLTKRYPKPTEIMSDLQVHDSVLNAHLVNWTSESRQEKFETIMQTYVKAALENIDGVSSSKEKAKVYHILGYFCYKQTKLPGAEEEIERQEKLIRAKQNELRELKVIIQNKSTASDEKKNAKRYYQRVQMQYEADKETYNSLFSNRSTCIEKALEFFMKAVSIDDLYDDEDIDKICALWLEYSEDEKINKITKKEIAFVSSHKFIPWINQLMSRLSDDTSFFQQILQKILGDICLKHPFHSLYHVMNLRVHKLYQFARIDATIHSRSAAAERLWQVLTNHNESYTRKVLNPIDTMSRNALSLATEKVPNNSVKKMNLENLKIGAFWMHHLKDLSIPLPTMNHLKISLDGNYTFVPRIISVDPTIQISASGISLPKIMKVQLSDGSRHRMLLKGSSDDLRQDAIMEQVFEKVNTILRNDKETRKRELKMRTYKVVPLGPQAGMIEFVASSIALSDILRPLHNKDPISFSEAREMMREAQTHSNKERFNVYLKIAKATPPVFRHFFYDTFPNIDDWFRSRQVYTRGIATNSIVGYMLGLGDRHLNNILIDKRTGEPIHIDLGVAFDQGKLLPVPELVPFRLTRDIVDGLGITGVEGSFKKNSDHVFRVLRSNVEKIVGILNVLKYDPLYSWAISPIRKKRLQENENENVSSKLNIEGDGSDAVRAVKGVESKLNANGLSVEASVQELIQEAIDYKNLAVIYLGWTPFY